MGGTGEDQRRGERPPSPLLLPGWTAGLALRDAGEKEGPLDLIMEKGVLRPEVGGVCAVAGLMAPLGGERQPSGSCKPSTHESMEGGT